MTEKMYELEFDNGSKIKVTGNHKFLTNLGWCRADELTDMHEIVTPSIDT
jgi:intein/homing endonuclease